MSALRRSVRLLPVLHSHVLHSHVLQSHVRYRPSRHTLHCTTTTTVTASPHIRSLHTTGQCHGGTIVPFKLSDIGEGIAEVTIKEWYVEVGDEVAQFDNICEVQSDKATVTITCRYDGVVKALHFEVDDTCRVGQALVDIEVPEEDVEKVLPTGNSESESVPVPIQTQGSGVTTATSPPPPVTAAPPLGNPFTATSPAETPPPPPVVKREVLTTPAVRKLAADKGVDLSLVPATGKGGRITKEDFLNYVAAPPTVSVEAPSPAPLMVDTSPMVTTIPTAHIWNTSPTSQGGVSSSGDTVIQIKGIAKVMVKTMTAAQQVPRFTFHDEYNMDNLVQLKKIMKEVGQEQKTKLTFMPLLIKAASQALTDFPMINAHVSTDCTTVTYKAAHNIGIATDTPHGLMVPNIKNVQNLSILEIARELNRLKTLSENNKLSTDDVTGGTFSLSNVGAVGGTYASPMLVVPEVCIGAFGKIQTRPAFDGDGNVIPSNTMCVSWSGDHRVLDGATVARFSNSLKQFLEDPSFLLFHLK